MAGETMPPQIDPAHVADVDLLSPQLVENWRSYATQWSTQAPFYVFPMGFPMLVVGRHDEVREVLLDRDRFSAAPPFGAPPGDIFMGLPQLNAMDGEGHDRVRRLLTPFFGPGEIERLTAVIDTIVDELLDAVDARGGAFDAMADLAEPLVERALLEGLFAVDAQQREQFIAYSNAMPMALAAAATGTYPPEFVSAFENTTALIEDLFEQRRREPREDFITGLVAAHDEGFPVSHEEMVGNTLAVYAGAQLATATSVAVLMMNLAADPDQFAILRAEPELVPDAVEESLRVHPAGLFGFPRYSLADGEVGGVPVFPGLPIQVGLAPANYDPVRYPDPGAFDIRRRPKGTLSFSTGAHVCLGARLARAILQGAGAAVARRYTDVRFADSSFVPQYGGVLGELKPAAVPLVAR